MNRSRFARWTLPRGKGHRSQEPGAAMFQGLRVRLTLWYCGVMGAALVLFGVSLYFGVHYYLLNPVEAGTAIHARGHVEQWLRASPARACSSFPPGGQPGAPPDPGFGMTEMVACFDRHGSLLPNQDTTRLPVIFLNNTLAQRAVVEHQPVYDIVNAGGRLGQIYRYALLVPDPAGHGIMGVVIAGESIQTQADALSSLLTLLLAFGGVALLGAGLGGLFLAHRALAPARIAWTNQQRFIADASHELRTPLTLLRADAEVLLRGREHLEAEDAALLEDIVAEAEHMAILANNLLTLARLDTSSSHQEHEVVNLTDIAHSAARRVQALANQAEISIQVEANAPVVVIGDPALLEQAVLALLDNAIKYNRRGGHVTAHTSIQQEQGRLEVRDSGIGVSAEHLPHLGERFYRVDKARSREAGGTGLGLSIARGITITHGGTLSMTSVPGQGTTVILQLPLARGPRPECVNDGGESVSSLSARTV